LALVIIGVGVLLGLLLLLSQAAEPIVVTSESGSLEGTAAPNAAPQHYMPLLIKAATYTTTSVPPPTLTATISSSPSRTATPTNTPTLGPGMPSNWNQLAGNPGRSGYVAKEVSPPWHVQWIWNGPEGGGDGGAAADHLPLPKGVQPVLGDGRMYVGHSDGVLRAISLANGVQVWESNLGAQVVNAAAYDAATNSVYIGTLGGRFWKLRAQTGAQDRSNRPGGELRMAPLLVGETVFIGSTNGTFYAFDKRTLAQRWSYSAGAALIASPAYAANHGGLIILLAEDKSVHALQASTGRRLWRTTVNADVDPGRGTVFADTYPVVSDANDVVIVRSYLEWGKMWSPDGGAPATVDEIRNYLIQNPELQSFFVLNLGDGSPRFVAPVMVGAIGNGGDFEAPPPQAVVKKLPDGGEVAYLLWRNRQACGTGFCDGREDTTLGEMDLATGIIRFVQDHRDSGVIRLLTDEQSPLSMAGDILFNAHWMLLGTLRIENRSPGLGGSYANPILTGELPPSLNTLAAGSCSSRSNHFCSQGMFTPCDGFWVDPGFYVFYASACVYDQYWTTPVRSAVIGDGAIYWKTVDGAILALQSTSN